MRTLAHMFEGLPVVMNPNILEARFERVQFRFPRSKRRRIRKKWAAQPRNFRVEEVPEPTAFLIGGSLVCGPLYYREILRLVS